MEFLQSYYTDIGIKRKNNQDSLALIKARTADGDVLLAMVCDGMGGYKFGEYASKLCIESFVSWFRKELPGYLYAEGGMSRVLPDWKRIIKNVNAQLCGFGKQQNISLGTTLTAFLFYGGNYYAAQVGDSRGYQLLHRLTKLTQDQSVVGREVEAGMLTEQEARSDKRRNILLESIGVTDSVNPEFYQGKIEPGATYLLCSDGFWHAPSDEELLRYFDSSQIHDNRTFRMHINYMIEQIKQRGEKDNITAVGVIPMEQTEGPGEPCSTAKDRHSRVKNGTADEKRRGSAAEAAKTQTAKAQTAKAQMVKNQTVKIQTAKTQTAKTQTAKAGGVPDDEVTVPILADAGDNPFNIVLNVICTHADDIANR